MPKEILLRIKFEVDMVNMILFFSKLSSPQIYHTQFYLVHYMLLCVMVFGKLRSTIMTELFMLNSLGFTSTKRKGGRVVAILKCWGGEARNVLRWFLHRTLTFVSMLKGWGGGGKSCSPL